MDTKRCHKIIRKLNENSNRSPVQYRAWLVHEKMMVGPDVVTEIDTEYKVIRCVLLDFMREEYLYEVESGDDIPDAILMQSTGVKDSEGKDVYEYDVLYHKEQAGIVMYCEGMFSMVNACVTLPNEWVYMMAELSDVKPDMCFGDGLYDLDTNPLKLAHVFESLETMKKVKGYLIR